MHHMMGDRFLYNGRGITSLEILTELKLTHSNQNEISRSHVRNPYIGINNAFPVS